MTDKAQVERAIRELAGRKKNVRLSEIDKIVDQLPQLGHTVTRKFNDHGVVIQIDSTTFSICTHNRGSSQLKPVYVGNFVRAMDEVGYGGDDDKG